MFCSFVCWTRGDVRMAVCSDKIFYVVSSLDSLIHWARGGSTIVSGIRGIWSINFFPSKNTRRLFYLLARFMPITVLCKHWDSVRKVRCMRSCSCAIYCVGVLVIARSPTRGFTPKKTGSSRIFVTRHESKVSPLWEPQPPWNWSFIL
jgi:hypothetical protein